MDHWFNIILLNRKVISDCIAFGNKEASNVLYHKVKGLQKEEPCKRCRVKIEKPNLGLNLIHLEGKGDTDMPPIRSLFN